MLISHCRVCGHAFFTEPLLRYANMPKAAQQLPDATTVDTDHGVNIEVWQCAGCGLVQLNNPPVSYYREVIRAAAFSEEMKAYRLQQFGGFIQQHGLQGKKVLELGCGRGEYLALLQACGADAHGLEQAEPAVSHCVQNGLKVSRGFIDNAEDRLPQAPFDAFVILNFLEHLPDINGTLRGLAGNLAAGGIGLVEVPNFDMILRKNLFSEFIPDHLFYFTRETLCTTLSLNGFTVEDCVESWHAYILSATVRKRPRLELSRFYHQQVALQRELDQFLQRFPERKVAVWGAGHQALAVLALAQLAGKVRYVVDSAPFKQGKFTPATHLPIVPPETLVSDPVDAVIVMAASYSDEVARTLRQKFDRRLHIAILRDFGLEPQPSEPQPSEPQPLELQP